MTALNGLDRLPYASPYYKNPLTIYCTTFYACYSHSFYFRLYQKVPAFSRSPGNSPKALLRRVDLFQQDFSIYQFGEASSMRVFIRLERWKVEQWRGTLSALALSMACLLMLAGCSLPWQHTTTTSGPGPSPTAQQVLATIQKNFRAVSSFHLSMKTENLGNTDANEIVIRQAEGDVLMPDKVQAQANILLSGQAVTVNLISVGENQYITDPITGQWRVVKGMLDPRVLTNPDTGLIALVGQLQHLTGPTSDNVNGVDCWRVNGLLPAKDLAFFTGGGVPAGTMLQTSVCAGKNDGLPYAITVTGQAATGDTEQTKRTFFISKYNENISIVAPQV